jgi:hypothetical protein
LPAPTVVASASFRGNSEIAEFSWTPQAAGNILICVLQYDFVHFSGSASVAAGWNTGSDFYYRNDTTTGTQEFVVENYTAAIAWCMVVIEVTGYDPAIAISGGGTSPFESPQQFGFGELSPSGVTMWASSGTTVAPAVAESLVLFVGHVTVQNLSTPNPDIGSGNYYVSNDSALTFLAEEVDYVGSYFFDYVFALSSTGTGLSPDLTFNPTQFDHAPLATVGGVAIVFHPGGSSTARVSQGALEALVQGAGKTHISQVVLEAVGIDDAKARTSQISAELVAIDAAKARVSQLIIELVASSLSYSLEVSPDPATVPIGTRQQFTATKVGTDGSRTTPAVFWSTNAGTIDDTGLFTPYGNRIGTGYYDSTGTLITFEVTATENDSGGG